MRSGLFRSVRVVVCLCLTLGLLLSVVPANVWAQQRGRRRADPETLVLCPLQRVEKLTRLPREVTSSNPDVATAILGDSVPGSSPVSVPVIITAQDNDTDAVRTTEVVILYSLGEMQEKAYRTIRRFAVQVLPRRRCETPQGLGTANLAGGPFAPDRSLDGERRAEMELCENETYTFNFYKSQRTLGADISNDNESVLSVTMEDPVTPEDEEDFFLLTLHGLSEGQAKLELTATERQQDGRISQVFIDRFLITVKKCGKTKEEPTKDKVGFIPQAPTYRKDEAYALASHVFTFPQGNIVVNVPQDAHAGETVSGSIIRQPAGNTPEEKSANAQQLAQYPVAIESVTVFADEPQKNFGVMLPSEGGAAGKTHLESTVTITDPETKKPLTTGVWQIASALLSNPQPAMQTGQEFSCSSQREASKPFEIKGPFDGKADNTQVSLGGQPVTVLGETPRGLIVIPRTESIGSQILMVDENGKHFEQFINTVPVPEQQQQQQIISDDPVKQAIVQMCTMTVDMYKQNIQSMVDEGWQSPKPPHKGIWVAILEYEITPQGSVQNLKVVQSSGYQPIDESAKARVYSMQGTFPKAPSCATEAIPITHTFKVIYH